MPRIFTDDRHDALHDSGLPRVRRPKFRSGPRETTVRVQGRSVRFALDVDRSEQADHVDPDVVPVPVAPSDPLLDAP